VPGLAGRLRKVVTSAGGSVLAQMVAALSSLLLQLVAAREFGADGFAAFTLLVAALVVITTLHTAWVGDSLTVLDRFEPRIRAALAASIVATVTLGVAGGTMLAAVLDTVSVPAALLFGLLVAIWLLEDTLRRMLTARLEFGLLASNAVLDLVVSFAVLGAFWLTGPPALETMLAAMCAGSLAGVAHAAARLPREELAWPGLRGAEMRELASFATWRAAQAGLRPLTLMLARVAIAAMVSSTALAATEGARLLLAPVLTMVNGVGAFLLSRMVRIRESGQPLRLRLAVTASVTLTAVTAAGGAVAVMVADPLEPFVTGGNFTIEPVTVAGWAAYAVSLAATLPVSMLATAYRHSRLVFTVRLVESLLGASILLALLAARPDLVGLAPFCIGVGGVATSVILVLRMRVLRGHQPDPYPEIVNHAA
jgi:O-antigen/teichoic acid export membrane protein